MSLSRRALPFAALCWCLAAAPLAAQRVTLDRNNPQTQLMGYYAAVMAFTPVGLPDRDGRLVIGGSATYIPTVSLQDRTVGFGGTKTEDSNLCPAYPRLAASKGFGHLTAEAGMTPPVTVCGVKANVVDAALGYRFTMAPTWDGLVRLSGYRGTIKAAITCGAGAIANPSDLTCFGGSPSQDRLAPAAGQLDVIAAYRGWQQRNIEPYVSVGFRYERIDFDVNYSRDTTQADAANANPAATSFVPALFDHSRYRATLARVQLAAGAAWTLGLVRIGGEVFYAPGAVLTVSGHAGILLGRRR